MDNCKELLVKKPRGGKETAFRALILTPTIICGLLTLMTVNYAIIFFIVTVGLAVGCFFVFQNTDIEYEYLYLDKEISVDKIMGKSKRKRVATLDVNKMEILAPEKSYQLDSYRNRQVKTTTDYSAGGDLPDMKLYVMYYDGNQKYLLNLDEEFAKIVKGVAPRKVFLD